MTKAISKGINKWRHLSKVWKTTALVLVALLLVLVISLFVKQQSYQDSKIEAEQIQSELIQTLTERQGEYDERSIVLSGTTLSTAKSLAERMGAELRITEDGSFATLTLPEGKTFLEIAQSEEYLYDLKKMSIDFEARISDFEEEYQGERLPLRPNYTVSDSAFSEQTYLDYINMQNVWSTTKGKGVTVAVIDTGIDTDHPEFAGRISEYSYNASEDKIVKDFVLEDGSYDWSLIEDEQGHGTSVAGVIGASMNSGEIVGIAPKVTLIVIKAECSPSGAFKRTSDLVFGLYYAIERDVHVVNMSFGSFDPQNPFAEPAQLAYDSDILCFAAAGNEATASLCYPAADENVIGVGALAEDSWELATYSNYGENVDLVAPGTTYTAKMGGGYATTNGTSLACPVAVGAASLFRSLSSYRYAETRVMLENLYASCADLGDLGFDWYFGYGAIDVSAWVLEARGTVTFDMRTDELDNTEQLFIRNHTLQDMPIPERLYAIFDGWYYDPQCTEEYNWYADVFTADLTLYANWVNEDDGIPYTYVELDDGTIEIRSYTGHRRYITIPDYIDGKVVSSIGEGAFAGETNLREVKLPKYLVRIRDRAFSGCSNLITMKIPDTVVIIGASAFQDNVRLSSIALGEGSQLTTVGDLAFSGCGKLRSFTVPNHVMYLNGSAFYGATSMISFSVQEGNEVFLAQDGVLFNQMMTEAVCYPAGKNGTYTLPGTVTAINVYAFAFAKLSQLDLTNIEMIGTAAFANSRLESIIIPDSVTQIGKGAFSKCAYLQSVTLGHGLTEISEKAFELCVSLQTVEIPNTVQVIGSGAFAGTSLQLGVTFEDNSTLTEIERIAFLGTAIPSIDIPASVTTIQSEAFSSCGNLEAVTFAPDSHLTTIGDMAFVAAPLVLIALPERLEHIGEFAFRDTNLQTVTLPASLVSLGSGAFASCSFLENIFVNNANTVYTDVDGVVYDRNKTALVAYPTGNSRTSYSIESTAIAVGEAAFYGSTCLYDVILPDGLQEIQREAFRSCSNLSYILIPDDVLQIAPYAFAECWNLSTVNFTENAKLPRISFGAFANCGLTAFRVPASVSTIAQGAFEGCANLTSFTFAANSRLSAISAYMFDGCDNLYSVTFEEGSALTSIQAHGFEGMTKLTSIDLGNAQITNIDNFAFRFCESLSSLVIPEGVTSIGRFAFYYCESLTDVTLPASLEHIGRFAFLGAENVNLYFASPTMPAVLDEDWDYGIRSYYLGVTNVTETVEWKYATLTNGGLALLEYKGTATTLDLSALHLGGDIVNIGGRAFAFSSVENVVLPETLVTIQAEAFFHATLKSVIIPKNVEFVGREAFAYTPITALSFATGSKVTVIEASAFEGTEYLKSVALPASLKTLGRAVFEKSGISSLIFAADIALTEIPEQAFAYTNITSLTIPSGITLINHNAFRNTAKLESVTWGSADFTVMSNAFYQSGLTSVHIPKNMTYIGEYAFVALPNLTAFTVDAENPYYTAVDGLLVGQNGRKLIAVPAGREGTLTVPGGIEVIGFGAFEDTKLSEVHFLPDANILSLGYRAFYNAKNITTMQIPASVVAIDYYAFANCVALESVSFAEGNQLRGVYEGAFYGCKNLSDITLPDAVVEVSDFAFYGCISLEKLPISETSELKDVYDYAFAYIGIKELAVPETVCNIGNYAFMGLRVKKVTVPDANAKELIIGLGAFEDCLDLEEITLPFIGASFEDSTITWFGYIFGAGGYEANATYVPENLKIVTITDGIGVIGKNAFNGLECLETIHVPHSVTVIEPNSFAGTKADYELTNEITTVSGYDWLGNPLYTAESGHFGKGISGHLTLADGVTRIGSSAFEGCTSLTSITIPDSVTSIGEWAFLGCSSLTSIALPNSVTRISEGAFASCTNLTTIVIPSNAKIHERVLGGCTRLRKVIVDENNPYISEQDGILYNKAKTQIITVTPAARGKVVLPGTMKVIPEGAFGFMDSNRNIHEVVISEGVEIIEPHAFSGCSFLAKITLPNSLTEIGALAFEHCMMLEIINNYSDLNLEFFSYDHGNVAYYANKIVEKNGDVRYSGDYMYELERIETSEGFVFQKNNRELRLTTYAGDLDTVTLPLDYNGKDYSLYHFRGASTVIVPEGFTVIGSSAFAESDIQNIILPSTLKKIEGFAFSGAQQLTEIILPEGVESVGEHCFSSCYQLKRVVIPSTLSHFGEGVFSYTNIEEIIVAAENTYMMEKDGVLYSEHGSQIAFVLENISGEIVLLDSLERIGDYTFVNKEQITAITLPDSLKWIGCDAFSGCTGLESIIIPDSVEGIDNYAFSGCTNLKLVTVGSGVSALGCELFSGCKSIEAVQLSEDNLYYILKNGIIYSKDMEAVVMGLPYIQGDIVLPSSVTVIHNDAFSDCTKMTSIEIPEGITRIGGFRNCSSLRRVSLPDSIESILYSAFYNCTSLVSINLPEKLSNIGQHAFANCSLYSIDLPQYLETIEPYAFSECHNLARINNNSRLKLVFGSEDHGGVARYAQSITDRQGQILLNPNYNGVEYFETEDHFWFRYQEGKYTLLAYGGFLDTVTLPKTINGQAYDVWHMRGVQNVIIPEGITYVWDRAFYGCETLQSVILPDSTKVIGIGAFDGCNNLREITIPNHVTLIEVQAFSHCQSLTHVTIPDSVARIGSSAFEGCTSLTSITIPDGVRSIDAWAFSVTAYYNDPAHWENGALYIGNHLIRVSEDMVFFDLRAGTVSVASRAFENCYSLKKVTLGGDCGSVLSGLTNLETLTITTMPTHGICEYFGWFASDLPLGLKNIVLVEGVRMNSTAFYDINGTPISGLTIYVEDTEKDTMWDENFPGWNAGNSVLYGDRWVIADFYGANGILTSHGIFRTSQVIRVPYIKDYTDGVCQYVFEGFDLDGDGVADGVPATSSVDVEARAIFTAYCLHIYTDEVVLQVPTCTEEGAKHLLCTVCGEVLEEITDPALGHEYGSVVTAPTCTEMGYTTYTCHCGDSYVDDYVAANGHSHTSVVTAPTCTEQGYTTYTCHCGDTYVDDYVSANGHDHKAKVTAPTCTEKGYTTYTCHCGDTYVADYVDAEGHDHVAKVTAPTCTEKGYTTYTCHCGDSYVADYVDATGHTEVRDAAKDATCTEDGLTEGVHCDICKEVLTKQEIIPAKGHDYASVDTTPADSNKGYITHTCNTCGDVTVEEYELDPITVGNSDFVTAPGLGFETSLVAMSNIKSGRRFVLKINTDAVSFVKCQSDVISVTCESNGLLTVTVHSDVKAGDSLGVLTMTTAKVLASGTHSFLSAVGLNMTGEFSSFVIYAYGDVNLDGSVDEVDLLLIKQYVVKALELNEIQLVYANVYADYDANGKARITSRDAVLLQQRLINMDVTLGEKVKTTSVEADESTRNVWNVTETVFLVPDFQTMVADMIMRKEDE